MSFGQTVALGALSGLSILLGMPLARLRTVSKGCHSYLNALAVGVLLFLLVDVLEHAVEPVEEAVEAGGMEGAMLFVLLAVGFIAGLMSLVYYGRQQLQRSSGATPERLAVLIAIGIGLHNFSEGLAIGSSAVGGAQRLALLLILGFGLHNITEAFGIAAPLAGRKSSWGFLLLLGLIGGLPNLIGTLVGYIYVSEALSLLFLSLAAGAIVYVICELLAVGRKLEAHAWSGWGIVTGLLLGFGTEMLLVAAGA